MKKSLRLLGLSLALVATHSFAEMLEAPVDDGDIDPLAFEFDFHGSFIGGADVKRQTLEITDFTEQNYLGRVLILPRTKVGILRLGAEYEIYDFDLPAGVQVPNRLQSAALIIGLDTKLSDSLLVRVEAKPGYYSGRDFEGQDFNVPFIMGGTYLYSSTLQFVFGIAVDLEAQYPVLPGGGFRWKFAPQWVLNATAPTPRLEYEVNRALTLYAGADIRWKNFRVDNDFVGDPGDPGDLNNAILSYSEIRTGGGVIWKIGEACKLTVEGGYLPYREFDYHRTNVRYESEGGAPYGSISLRASF
ncbi:MAG TPA: DUF6268 family outer membrane beta-barrel protein [Chthoniobacterales bacterium]|nr:DUF6268 family outer membrane beta-barrel protein [Chthoniobacterales bacterium]